METTNTKSDDEGWTVRLSDYERLADAARNLRGSCKHKLPPGCYALLDDECRDIDAILSPNDQLGARFCSQLHAVVPSAGSAGRPRRDGGDNLP